MQKVTKIKKLLISNSFFKFWKYQFLIRSDIKKIKPYKRWEFFDIKIIYIALFLFFYDIIQIPLNNSGGHIAHIGGAIWGYYYCISNNKGEDFTQSIFNIFKTTKKKNTKATQNNNNFDQKKIDSILDKISDSGYDSLTKKEKEYLFKVGKNQDK